MYIVVGLGNRGKKYKNTRHNVGFMVVDEIARHRGNLTANPEKMKNALLIKPEGFMNRSGEVVRRVVLENPTFEYRSSKQFQSSSDLSNLLIIHDDLDLPLGTVRIKFGGSSAGHKGVQSIIDSLGSDKFWRVRVGIGRPEKKLKVKSRRLKEEVENYINNYVLSKFNADEQSVVKKLIVQTAGQLLKNLEQGSILGETFTIDSKL